MKNDYQLSIESIEDEASSVLEAASAVLRPEVFANALIVRKEQRDAYLHKAIICNLECKFVAIVWEMLRKSNANIDIFNSELEEHISGAVSFCCFSDYKIQPTYILKTYKECLEIISKKEKDLKLETREDPRVVFERDGF